MMHSLKLVRGCGEKRAGVDMRSSVHEVGPGFLVAIIKYVAFA